MNLSGGETKRLIKQGAVSINDKKIVDIFEEIEITDAEMIIKIGKKNFFRHKK